MIPGIQIEITKDTATPAVAELAASLTPARLANKVGPAVQDLVEQWLAKLGPNKMGYPSTGFYEKFARNVRWTPQPDGVLIGILPVVIHGRTVGLGQRVFGGPIAPVNAKALSIPINELSYGKVPSDFADLEMIVTPKGAYLVQKTASRARGAAPTVTFLFKLSFGVTQAGDRNVLPSDQQILDTAIQSLTE